MSTMMDWAEREFDIAGTPKDDMMREATMNLLAVFCDEGHSGFSAPHAVRLFSRLASWKPLTPLTGADDEWDIRGNGKFQNKRCSSVFKDADGGAYYIYGIVFWEWNTSKDGERYKSYFTNKDSHVPVTFPWAVPDEPEYREAAK